MAYDVDPMDRKPCFDAEHERTNEICITCKRPTPWFPEWIGKLQASEEARRGLEDDKRALKKARDLDADSIRHWSAQAEALEAKLAESEKDKIKAQDNWTYYQDAFENRPDNEKEVLARMTRVENAISQMRAVTTHHDLGCHCSRCTTVAAYDKEPGGK